MVEGLCRVDAPDLLLVAIQLQQLNAFPVFTSNPAETGDVEHMDPAVAALACILSGGSQVGAAYHQKFCWLTPTSIYKAVSLWQ